MNYSYSPIRRCEAAHTMVLTNQTQQTCAQEHGCPPTRSCPLSGCFAKVHTGQRGPGHERWDSSRS